MLDKEWTIRLAEVALLAFVWTVFALVYPLYRLTEKSRALLSGQPTIARRRAARQRLDALTTRA